MQQQPKRHFLKHVDRNISIIKPPVFKQHNQAYIYNTSIWNDNDKVSLQLPFKSSSITTMIVSNSGYTVKARLHVTDIITQIS